MSQAYIDRFDTLECLDKGGVIRSVTRMARVVDLIDSDYQVLWSALEDAGVPKVPSRLPGTGFEALLLDERHPKVHSDDPSKCDVTLIYRHVLEGTQEIPTPYTGGDNDIPDNEATMFAGPMIYGKMRCSIQQKPTNFYYDWDSPFPGPLIQRQITVQHTYPRTDAHFGNGIPVVQGGEIQVPVASQNFTFGGYINTDKPDIVAGNIIATVNKFKWRGKQPVHWLCSEVQWEIVRSGRYQFHFEIQHDPFGWDPFAVFVDQQTGRPPPKLIEGVGYKKIPYLRRVDYNQFFQSFFES